METNSRKMNNKNVNIENGDLINGDKNIEFATINSTNYYLTIENSPELTQVLTGISKENKEAYSDFYKRYINKFQELRDYLMSLIYPKMIEKNYEFSSNTLLFGKKIIDWVFGLDEYPFDEIELLYKELQQEFDIKEDSILGKRWKANKKYFDGNLLEAKNGYIELKNIIDSKNDIPYWLKDDILIDGRNILNKYDNSIDKLTYPNPFQEEIDKNKHKLSYPDVDRIKSEIFERVSDHIFKNKNRGKYTTIIGIGLEEMLNSIQDLTYITIFYGSITHLKLIRSLISEVMYMYADTFEDEDFYKITLKMLFLAGEKKKYKNLLSKLRLNYKFVNSKIFVDELVKSLNSIISFEKLGNEVLIYDLYGRIIEDKQYADLELKMLDSIEISKDYHMNYIEDIFRSIPSNLSRFNNISRLLMIIMDYLEKNYSRFFYEFGNILNNINIKNLSEENFKLYKSIIDRILTLDNKDIINISYAMINIKLYKPKIKDYDEILLKEKTFENIIYNIEDDRNIVSALKDIIQINKDRCIEKENKPGVTIGYGTEYNLEKSFFEKDTYIKKTRDVVIKEYIPLAKLILESKNQLIKEKVKSIKTLSYILLVEEDEIIRKNIIDTINNCKFSKQKVSFIEANNKTEEDVRNYMLMANYIYGQIDAKQLFLSYLTNIINDENQIEEVLKCIEIARLKNGEDIKLNAQIFYYIFLVAYKENDIDIRSEIIELSDIFIGTEYEEEILNKLLDNDIDLSYEESVGYLRLIKNISGNELYKYKDIIEKLRNNANFNIRIMVEKYIVRNKNE